MSGYVTFLVGGRELAGRLEDVQEVVRAAGVEALPGMRAPVTGVLELRGMPVSIVDLRSADAPPGAARPLGDVLVLLADEAAEVGAAGMLGMAVDAVVAVHAEDGFTTVCGGLVPPGLPAYVRAVLHRAVTAEEAEPCVVFLVDLLSLAGLDDRTAPPARPVLQGPPAPETPGRRNRSDVAFEDRGLGQA